MDIASPNGARAVKDQLFSELLAGFGGNPDLDAQTAVLTQYQKDPVRFGKEILGHTYPDAVVKLVETAGRKIGLCDWRPAKKGRFGRFVITKIEVLPVIEKEEKAEEVEYTAATAPKELLELAGV